ncbi:hypothetical protein [Mesorhizobium xinjiangense]|uniref:hypothetical protein n=1 Tax=Mesorhizobium xinjiangense TaxID=2678685 RepID=UPI0012EEB19F|nr:hypothetical protein [Mesorhizobium xinjiangense]
MHNERRLGQWSCVCRERQERTGGRNPVLRIVLAVVALAIITVPLAKLLPSLIG